MKKFTMGVAKRYATALTSVRPPAMSATLSPTARFARSTRSAPRFCPTVVSVPCARPMAGRKTSEVIRLPMPKAAMAAPCSAPTAVVPADAMVQLQQQGEGELGHRVGGVGRHVADGHASGPGGLDVHHVVAGRGDGDQAELAQGVQRLGREGHLVGDGHLGAAAAVHDLPDRRAVVHLQLAQRLQRRPGRVLGLQRPAVEHDDTHGVSFRDFESQLSNAKSQMPGAARHSLEQEDRNHGCPSSLL